jgi:hypothetical protein
MLSGTDKLLKESRVLVIQGTQNEIDVGEPEGPGDLSANRYFTLVLSSTVDLGGKSSFEIPNGSGPTTNAFGEIAGKNNAWGTNRGAVQFYDGSDSVYLVGVLTSPAPTHGQVPRYKSGGTIEWNSLAAVGVNFQAGELIQGDTANDSIKGLTKIPRSLFLASNGSGEPIWFTGAERTGFFEDWIANNAQGSTNWANVQAGTAASASIAPSYVDGNHPGIVRLDAGTDAIGRCGIHKGLETIKLGGGPIYWEALIRIEDLSSTDPEFDVVAGLADVATSSAIQDGVYFEYDRNATDGIYWRTVCVNGGTSISADTVAVQVQADTWIKLRIEINASGNSADFYVNGVLRQTTTSNLPTGGTAPLFKIVKSSDPNQGDSRYFDIDYCSFKSHFTSPR